MHINRLIAVGVSAAVLAATLVSVTPHTETASAEITGPSPKSVVVESTAEEFTGEPTPVDTSAPTPTQSFTTLSPSLVGPGSQSRWADQGVIFSGSITSSSEAPRDILIEELVDGAWKAVFVQRYAPDALSNVRLFMPRGVPGLHLYRVRAAASNDAPEAVGAAFTVDIKARALGFSVNNVVTRLSQLATQDGVTVTVSSQAMHVDDSFVLERFDKVTNSWIAVDTKPYSYSTVVLRDARQTSEKDSVRYRVRNVVTDPLYVGTMSPEYTVSYKKDTTVLQSTTAPIGKTVTTTGTNTVSYTGRFKDTIGSRSVQLQAYNATKKTWSTVASTNSANGSWKLELGPSDSASTVYRIFVPEIADATQVVTGSFTLKRTPSTVTIANGGGKLKTVPWEANTLAWTVYDDKGTNVQIQQLVGKNWRKVADRTVDAKKSVSFAMPKGNTGSANQSFRYRAVVLKHKVGYKDSSGGDRTIVWENPNRYTGTAKKIYDYMKGQCPAIFISVDNSLEKKGVWALSYLGEDRTAVYGNIPAQHLRTVALHECGHHRQWKFYSGDWNGFLNKMNKVYGQRGNLGMEQNADCIANAWAKNSYFAYKGNCNGERGVAGKTLASNRKY